MILTSTALSNTFKIAQAICVASRDIIYISPLRFSLVRADASFLKDLNGRQKAPSHRAPTGEI